MTNYKLPDQGAPAAPKDKGWTSRIEGGGPEIKHFGQPLGTYERPHGEWGADFQRARQQSYWDKQRPSGIGNTTTTTSGFDDDGAPPRVLGGAGLDEERLAGLTGRTQGGTHGYPGEFGNSSSSNSSGFDDDGAPPRVLSGAGMDEERLAGLMSGSFASGASSSSKSPSLYDGLALQGQGAFSIGGPDSTSASASASSASSAPAPPPALEPSLEQELRDRLSSKATARLTERLTERLAVPSPRVVSFADAPTDDRRGDGDGTAVVTGTIMAGAIMSSSEMVYVGGGEGGGGDGGGNHGNHGAALSSAPPPSSLGSQHAENMLPEGEVGRGRQGAQATIDRIRQEEERMFEEATAAAAAAAAEATAAAAAARAAAAAVHAGIGNLEGALERQQQHEEGNSAEAWRSDAWLADLAARQELENENRRLREAEAELRAAELDAVAREVEARTRASVESEMVA